MSIECKIDDAIPDIPGIQMENIPKDRYECVLSEDGKNLYYRNGIKVSSKDVPKEIIGTLRGFRKEDRALYYFHTRDLKKILIDWNIPMDLYEPLKMYYLSTVNHLEILLDLLPSEPWDWYGVSQNPNVTWEFIHTHRHKKEYGWVMPGLSRNVHIKLENMKRYNRVAKKTEHTYDVWNKRHMSANPNVTWDFIQRYVVRPDPMILVDIRVCADWDMDALSFNPNIGWDVIRENINLPWDWYTLSLSSKITWDIVKNNLYFKNDSPVPWSWSALSQNPNITWDIIKENLYIPISNASFIYPNGLVKIKTPWNWPNVSLNPNITMDIVFQNQYIEYPEDGQRVKIEWKWFELSDNKTLTWEMVRKNPYKPWNWSGISRNPNVTWDIVKENPTMIVDSYIPFNYQEADSLPGDPEGSRRFVTPWDMKAICSNENVGMDVVKKDGNNNVMKLINWDWYSLSSNPTLTWEVIYDNQYEPWNWEHLSYNDFGKKK